MLYREYEEKIENDEDFQEYEDLGVINCDEDIIIVYGPMIDFPELGISCTEGVYCNKDDEEESGYMADFSLTLIYDIEFKDISDYLYWEQDPIPTAIHNFFYGAKKLGQRDIEDQEITVRNS